MCAKPNDFESLRAELGLQLSDRMWVGGHHLKAKKLAISILEGNTKPPTGPLDYAIITSITFEEAAYFASKLKDRLCDKGKIWIVVEEEKFRLETKNVSQPADVVPEECLQKSLAKAGFRSAGYVQLSSDFRAFAFKSSPASDH